MRGGHRDGAGRKRLDKVVLKVYVSQDVKDRLQMLADKMAKTLSDTIAYLIEHY